LCFHCEECKLGYLDKGLGYLDKGLGYLDKGIAQKCEEWCRKNKSCNIEYIKYTVGVEE